MEPEINQNNQIPAQAPVADFQPEKPKHKYLPVLITILVMLLIAGGLAAGVWYYMDQQAKTNKASADQQISNLQKRVSDSQKSQTNASTTTPNTTKTPAEAPDKVVNDFYSWYMSVTSLNGQQKAQQTNSLTTEFQKKLLDCYAQGIKCTNADLILVSNNIPFAVIADSPKVLGDYATVIVHEKFNGYQQGSFTDYPLEVLLKNVDGQWKIDDVISATKLFTR